MATFDFKAATPAVSFAGTEFLFGAASQAASTPTIYPYSTILTYLQTTGAGFAVLALPNVFSSAIQTASALTTTSPGWYAQITGDSVPRVRVGLNATDVASLSFGGGSGARDAFLEYVAAANLRHGAADAAAPVAQLLSVQNVLAGTTNTAGANTTLKGSAGTGTGQGGQYIIQLAPKGTTGTSQNAFTNIANFGFYSAATTLPAFWLGQSSPSSSNYTLLLNGNSIALNAPSGGSVLLSVNDGDGLFMNATVVQMGAAFKFGWTATTLSGTIDTILTRAAAASVQHGAADAAAPVAQTIRVQSVVAGTANTAGTDWTHIGSIGTGTGAGGKTIFQGAPAGGASRSASSVTCTNASPGVFTLSSHALAIGQAVTLAGTAVPTGFTAGTVYYICSDGSFSANAFTLSTSIANAYAGTAVNTSSTGTSVTLTTGQNTLFPGITITAPATVGTGATLATQPPSVVVGGTHALAAAGTDGFIYMPGGAGPPTGTPTAQGTGTYPLYWDHTNKQLYIYDGAWLQPKTPGAAAIVNWQ